MEITGCNQIVLYGEKVCKRQKMNCCSICRRQFLYDFNTAFRKSCIVFFAKPKEKDPIKVIFIKSGHR